MSWAYDWVADIVSLGRWKLWIETSLSFLIGNKILELGHGPGHLMVKLEQSSKQSYGIDLSSQMSRIASIRLKRLSLPCNLSIAKAQQLPFGTEEFDHVVATFPTEYIFDERTLKEVYRVLKPGGSTIIIPAAYITGTGVLDKVTSWLFKITGQAPEIDNRAVEAIMHAGFEVDINRMIVKSSMVVALLAKRIS